MATMDTPTTSTPSVPPRAEPRSHVGRILFAVTLLVPAVPLASGCSKDPQAPGTPSASAAASALAISSGPAAASSPPATAAGAAPDASTPATAPPPSTDSDRCETASDCVLTTFVGCCARCPCGPLRAMTSASLRAHQATCARESCPKTHAEEKCKPCADPEKEGMVARCEDHACRLVETSKAGASGAAASPEPIACKTDDDCWMDDAHKPIARPKNLRGRKITPCKGGSEHAPSCKEGACIVRAFKC